MSTKVGQSYGNENLAVQESNYSQRNGYGPSPSYNANSNNQRNGYGPSPNYSSNMNNNNNNNNNVNNSGQKNGYGPNPNYNQKNGYGPNPNYNSNQQNGYSQTGSSRDDMSQYNRNSLNRTHNFKKLPQNDQELNQRYHEYQQYTKLINEYLPKEKCARCKTLKTFDCEHATPVRDDLNFNYFKTGHFYTTPKQIRELNQIKKKKSGVEMSRSTNALYEPNVMVSSRNEFRGMNGHNNGPQYDSYNNINMTKSANYNTNNTYTSNNTTTTTTHVTTTNNQQTTKTVKKKRKDDDPDGCCSIQ